MLSQDTTEQFNEDFASVFTQEDVASMPDAKQFFNGSENDFLKNVLVTEEKIRNKLNKLKVDKAVGAGEMSPRLLKECQEEICHPLTKILQKSQEEGVGPEDWKTAIVLPIYKKEAERKQRTTDQSVLQVKSAGYMTLSYKMPWSIT